MTQTTNTFDDGMAEILDSFLVEAHEILEQLGKDLIVLERQPADSDLLNAIFRGVHTLKGTSSFLGFEQFAGFAHELETLLNKLRKGEKKATRSVMDVLLAAHDVTAMLLGKIESRDDRPAEIGGILAKIRDTAESPEDAPDVPATDIPAGQPQDAAPASERQKSRTADSTLRVDISRLDDLMNLVGELVLGRNRLSQLSQRISDEQEHNPLSRDLSETSAQIDFVTTELQMAVMRTRMLPVARLFNRLPRLVRDVTKETGKSVDLVLRGEDTELDKSIIEELNDPLVHIIRNAIDHGIEDPSERARLGKPASGLLVVEARHEGNNIILSVADDGKGMDIGRIGRRAVERELLTQAQLDDMTEAEVLNLVFLPGFSTAESVTALSGRGVGMDVVRTNIAKLKGTVDLQSKPGAGTTLTIKLPLTLAIIQALLVAVQEEVFAIPVASVIEVVRVRAEDLYSVNQRHVIRLREDVLPVVTMAEVIGIDAAAAGEGWIYAVVVGWADQRVGIMVDQLLGQREIVIKSLGEQLGKLPGIAGSTILGDGRTILIVDTEHLMSERSMRKAPVVA